MGQLNVSTSKMSINFKDLTSPMVLAIIHSIIGTRVSLSRDTHFSYRHLENTDMVILIKPILTLVHIIVERTIDDLSSILKKVILM